MLKRRTAAKALRLVFMVCFCVTVLAAGTRAEDASPAPRNVILFIGDGIGFEHVRERLLAPSIHGQTRLRQAQACRVIMSESRHRLQERLAEVRWGFSEGQGSE